MAEFSSRAGGSARVVTVTAMQRKTRSLLRRAREVGPEGLALLVRTFCLLLAAKMALRWIAVKKILAWKQRPVNQGARVDAVARCARIRWAVLTVARYSPVEFVCFPQCLAAAELLHGSGIASRLHYGVAREDTTLKTHTWLEANGQILIGGEVADQFSRLDVY